MYIYIHINTHIHTHIYVCVYHIYITLLLCIEHCFTQVKFYSLYVYIVQND